MSAKKTAGNKPRSNSKKGTVIQPEGPAKSRREELQELSEKELKELFFNHFGKEPDENLQAEDLVDQLDAALPPAPKVAPKKESQPTTTKGSGREGAKIFKSKETGKEFRVTGDISGHVVVRQVKVQELNGGMVEVPYSESIQTYRPEIFEKMQADNFFSESLLKIEILQSA
jgi:hypothetical protein